MSTRIRRRRDLVLRKRGTASTDCIAAALLLKMASRGFLMVFRGFAFCSVAECFNVNEISRSGGQ